MRCPYCGGLNSDRATYCVSCGRDISTPPPRPRPPLQPPRSPYPSPQRPAYTPPRSPQPVTPMQAPPYSPPRQPAPPPRREPSVAPIPSQPKVPEAPEPPAPFPPRTIDQLKALQAGALPYTVLDETVHYNRKQVVRISYSRCSPWQQVGTLLRALQQYRSSRFEIIVILGSVSDNIDAYQYNNGMVQFDQNARLGSQSLNRYQIETGNGFSSDSLRIVLTE